MRALLEFNGCCDLQVSYGNHDDPRPVLTVGEVYEVERLDVRSFKTHVHLVGIEGRFNSVCFTDVTSIPLPQHLQLYSLQQ